MQWGVLARTSFPGDVLLLLGFASHQQCHRHLQDPSGGEDAGVATSCAAPAVAQSSEGRSILLLCMKTAADHHL